MGLFRKQRQLTVSPVRSMISGRLNGIYGKINTAWANWMALHTARLTKKNWITLLTCFALLMGSYSGYLIISAFTGKPATSIKVGNIRKPAHTGSTGEVIQQARIAEAEFRRIEQFHRYMDSLSADSIGKKAYDSIVAKRPGLMDSIRMVENYYQQFKNK